MESADLGCVLNQLVQVLLLRLLPFFAFLGQLEPCLLPSQDAFLALLFVPDRSHLANLVEYLGAEPRHLFHVLEAILHFCLEGGVISKRFPVLCR